MTASTQDMRSTLIVNFMNLIARWRCGINEGARNGTASRGRLVPIGFGVVGAVLLLAEHRMHVLPFQPWLILAACPLMHVFMHRGHGGHEDHPGTGAQRRTADRNVDKAYRAQRERRLATAGPYARIRHPQYVGFILIMLGFLVQWPTLVALAMFPVLVTMYVL